MLSLNQKKGLCSLGYELDCHPNAFGHLKNSSDLYQVSLKDTTLLQANDLSKFNLQSREIPEELRRRILEDGYLYLPGLLNPQAIWQARWEIAESLAAEGSLASGYSIVDCVARPGLPMSFRPDLALKSPTLKQLLYSGTLMEFFQGFLAGDVLIFSMFTIHASLDNHSQFIRLSSDSRYQLASEPVDERWIGIHPMGHSTAAKRGRLC